MTTRRYTVGELAAAAHTKSVTIRYYERRGLMLSPQRTPAGYRIYKQADLDRLVFILRCRHFGFDLESISELLELADQKNAPCLDVDAKVARHLGEIRKRLAELRSLEKELHRLSVCCKGGGVIGDCRIVESLSGDAGRFGAADQPAGTMPKSGD